MDKSSNQTNVLNMSKWKNSMLLLFALQGMAFSSWTSRTPEVRDILQASTSTMGWIILGIALGSIAGLISASYFIKRVGAKKTIFCSSIVVSAGLFISGLSTLLAMNVLVF
ncbi:MFS transporter [Paenibacillus xylanexedens]|uniref:MFS transporter n=1 Tax=Paenibacillus xylanexedens TaxID=528191 RepID=UPI0021B4B178|nr:MFS transporter [Paenibacillus xylanexedens]